jgi:lysozyme
VRLYLPGERPPQEHSLKQIASARANGCTVGGYIWCYPDFDSKQSVWDALALAARANLDLPVLWLDVETYGNDPGPSVGWLQAAVEECQAKGVQAGIYTGRWYWRYYAADSTELSDLPLWVAQYDGVADLDSVKLFGGWKQAAGKQYQGEGLDLDVFREEFTTR